MLTQSLLFTYLTHCSLQAWLRFGHFTTSLRASEQLQAEAVQLNGTVGMGMARPVARPSWHDLGCFNAGLLLHTWLLWLIGPRLHRQPLLSTQTKSGDCRHGVVSPAHTGLRPCVFMPIYCVRRTLPFGCGTTTEFAVGLWMCVLPLCLCAFLPSTASVVYGVTKFSDLSREEFLSFAAPGKGPNTPDYPDT